MKKEMTLKQVVGEFDKKAQQFNEVSFKDSLYRLLNQIEFLTYNVSQTDDREKLRVVQEMQASIKKYLLY